MQILEDLFKWQNVKTYLKDKFKVLRETEDILSFEFALENDRTQIVFVEKCVTHGGIECIQILSRIGEIVPKRVNSALEAIAQTMAGGMIKMGEDYFVRSTLSMNGLDPEILDEVMATVTIIADQMEAAFVGGDEN